jgi:FkbM family methyltransferase
MAQISRAIKTAFLRLCPPRVRGRLLENFPNLRKAAPIGTSSVFNNYHSGITVNIDTRYKVERIMWSGLYEPPLMRYLDTLPMTGWTCIDVGANVGAVALVLAKKVGATGKVFAFEPGPPTVKRLVRNFALNPELAAVTELIPHGLGKTPGELWWTEEKGNPGNALLDSTGSQRVIVETLDGYLRQRAVERVDFLKIDVEGMEFEVAKGATESLHRFHPIIYYETLSRYSSAGTRDNFGTIDSFLVRECGYTLHRIMRDGTLSPVSKSGQADYTVAIPLQQP